MRSVIIILGVILLVTLFASCSQTKGMKALEELHKFTGNWKGTGKIYTAPNQEGIIFTSKVVYKGVYDNVLVRKKEITNVNDGTLLASLAFLGWDWENNQPIILSVGNDGKGAKKHKMSISKDNTYQFIRTTKNKAGQIVVDETITTLKDNSYTVITNRIIDGGAPFISFEGTYMRSANEDIDLKNVSSVVPLSESTKRIACMAGFYHQQGHFQGHPIDGDEKIELILGGQAMFINFKFKEDAGDGYFGSSLTSWDNDKNKFTGFMVSNDGMASPFHAWLSESKTQLIYEPLDKNGKGMEYARWYAQLNQDIDHCLLKVAVNKLEENSEVDKGLFIKFTKTEQ